VLTTTVLLHINYHCFDCNELEKTGRAKCTDPSTLLRTRCLPRPQLLMLITFIPAVTDAVFLTIVLGKKLHQQTLWVRAKGMTTVVHKNHSVTGKLKKRWLTAYMHTMVLCQLWSHVQQWDYYRPQITESLQQQIHLPLQPEEQ